MMNARLILLSAILLGLVIYLPGITGGFVFDDYNNIINNDKLRNAELSPTGLLQAGWSGQAGPLKRPLAMMSFALNFATTGDFIGAFKFTNLIIHLANGVLVFVFLRLILATRCFRRNEHPPNFPIIAAVATAIWVVHPINLTSVLYVVQRMNSLATLFSLLALIFYVRGRLQLQTGKRQGWWSIVLGAPLASLFGVLSKENAILTIPLIALVEVCFFRFATHIARDKLLLQLGFGFAIVLPMALAAMYLSIHPEYVTARYAVRPFTLVERLLTESRVLWYYLFLIVAPRLREFGLFHDDFPVSSGMFDPISTALSLGGIALAIFGACLTLRRWPLAAFAVGWYLIGHFLESSFIGLELVHEHRNYLPGVGVIFALTYAVGAALRSHAKTSIIRLTTFSVIGIFAGLTCLRAGDWSDPTTLAFIEAERHPNSYRAVYDLARIEHGLYLMTANEKYYDAAVAHLERAAAINTNAKQPFAALIKLAYSKGGESKPEWEKEAIRRYREGLFHWSESLELHNLVQCRSEPGCAIPRDVIFKMISAVLSNPTLPDSARAQISIDLAILYVNEAKEMEPALALVDDAIEIEPNRFSYHRIRAQLLMFSQHYSDAEAAIKYMRSVSSWDDYLFKPVVELDALETQLAEVKQAMTMSAENAETVN